MRDQIDDINRRIKKRHLENIDDCFKEKKKKTSFLYSLSMTIMVVMCFSLGVLIYGKHDEKGNFIKEKFNLEIDFSQINDRIGSLLNQTVVFNFNWLDASTASTVGASNFYYPLSPNSFYNETSLLYALGNGYISYVNSNTIVVRYDNQISASHTPISESQVKINDRVIEGLIIGSFNQSITINFFLQNNPISYEEAISYF